MTKQIIRLVYPPALIEVPIIHSLIRRFDITVNILQAQVSEEGGWLEIKISGPDDEIDKAKAWLVSQGVEIQNILAH